MANTASISANVAGRYAQAVFDIAREQGDFDLLAKVYVPEDQDVGRYLNDRLFDIPDICRTQTTMTFKAF